MTSAPTAEDDAGRGEWPASQKPTGRSLCSMCMGSFPETALTIVDGASFCADCSPLSGRRTVPDVDELRVGSFASVPPPQGSRGGDRVGVARGASRAGPIFAEERPAGGGTKVLFGVLFVVLLAGGAVAAFSVLGGDRIDRLVSGASDDGRSYLLLQRYEAGKTQRYALRQRMLLEVEGGLMGAQQSMEASAKVAGRVSMDVLDVDDRGNASLRMSLDGFTVQGEAWVDGQSVGMDPSMNAGFEQYNGLVLEMKVDAFGEAVGEPRVVSGSLGNGLSDLLGGQMKGVPHEEVAAGYTWTSEDRVPLEAMQGLGGLDGLSIRATYEVEGVKKYAGRECLVISVEGEMAGGGGGNTPQLAMFGEFSLDVDLKGVVFFEPQTGAVVKAAMDIQMEMSGASAAGGLEMRMALEQDLDLQ